MSLLKYLNLSLYNIEQYFKTIEIETAQWYEEHFLERIRRGFLHAKFNRPNSWRVGGCKNFCFTIIYVLSHHRFPYLCVVLLEELRLVEAG